MNIQRVKIGDEEMVDITGIQTTEDGKQTVAVFSTAYKNVNGFSALTKITKNHTATHKAYFTFYDDGWKLEKK